MEHITTYMGEDFDPLTPNADQIHVEDIAHAQSQMCRANGHFVHFYSVAQHSVNCANEAKARGLSVRVQIACLLHDGSEAYLSDITRPVKSHLSNYIDIEKCLQDLIYEKFLGLLPTNVEIALIKEIDGDMLKCEFDALMKKKVFDDCPSISSTPSFAFRGFLEVESEFVEIFNGAKSNKQGDSQTLRKQIAQIEHLLISKTKVDINDYVEQHRIQEMLTEKLHIKRLSAQVDIAIHAYGILLVLSQVVEEGEIIEYLSLGAGNTGKDFDVATTKRIAEFKFATWDDGSNTIRQNGIFKDFLELSEDINDTGKAKQIYCMSADDVIRFFSNSERSLASVLSKNSINKKHTDIQNKYNSVREYYHANKDEVEIIDLKKYIDFD